MIQGKLLNLASCLFLIVFFAVASFSGLHFLFHPLIHVTWFRVYQYVMTTVKVSLFSFYIIKLIRILLEKDAR